MKIRKEVKIGIFGILMLFLLVWGVDYLTGTNIFVSNNTYYAQFDKADGLKSSTEIRLRGLKIGTVTGVGYNPLVDDKVIVEFTVKSDYKIPVDSRIVAANTLIISGTVLDLEYGQSHIYFHGGDTIPSVGAKDAIGMISSEIEEIKDKVYTLLNNLNTTLDNVNTALNEDNLNNIGNAIKNIDNLIAEDLSEIARNLNYVTGSLSENSYRIENILANVDEFTDSLNSIDLTGLVSEFNTTVNNLNEITSKLNEGSGTIAQLINNDSLYDSLVSATGNLSLLLDDIKANPKRYVSISVFGGRNKN
ncbi:MAG: MlaD family protein [Rikenellaceae bacterium]|nr:MlaD family protein [Rikenellaceae bacterium]